MAVVVQNGTADEIAVEEMQEWLSDNAAAEAEAKEGSRGNKEHCTKALDSISRIVGRRLLQHSHSRLCGSPPTPIPVQQLQQQGQQDVAGVQRNKSHSGVRNRGIDGGRQRERRPKPDSGEGSANEAAAKTARPPKVKQATLSLGKGKATPPADSNTPQSAKAPDRAVVVQNGTADEIAVEEMQERLSDNAAAEAEAKEGSRGNKEHCTKALDSIRWPHREPPAAAALTQPASRADIAKVPILMALAEEEERILVVLPRRVAVSNVAE
ncbi:unnamed protein product [Vitrella brassicaformis CCMP3155]|uniref:Uncharacterized protein n=1 Tax=Vitrella brassicaformis (strain CCMP3155) TaxID=1169540 RepID=A0A0G4EAN2_VITBC|nr:unnamed protein product [Vitrella brassicaformis CCMP3155]|eukprot:CEL92342.1 unnamed protein product [Vitrella brassicaformis CCMP3155]